MTARWAAVVAISASAAACLDVSDEHRCATSADCPQPGRCEPTGNCTTPDPTCGATGFRYDSRSAERSDVCVVTAIQPIDTLAPIDLAAQGDSTASGCAPPGARDAMIEIDSPTTQLLYVLTDPAMTNTAAALIVRQGPCPGTAPITECSQHPCPPTIIGMVAAQIPMGRSCLVVESADGVAAGQIRLLLYPALRPGTALTPGMAPLPAELTCGGVPNPTAMCSAPANTSAAGYFFAVCPGAWQLEFQVTPSAPLDAMIGLRPGVPYGPESTCADTGADQAPEAIVDYPIDGPGGFWLVVESSSGGTCGSFSVDGFSVMPR